MIEKGALPAYIAAAKNGRLDAAITATREILKECALCPRECRVDRLSDERGVCRTGYLAEVSSFAPHFGEETPLVGKNGSGTIFFTHCNLLCIFCQNYDISHLGDGEPATDDALADMMITLQNRGCHNINFVTPSHVVPQILSAVKIAAGKGLHIPLIYNSGGYDKLSTLQLLSGIIDIYMPDFKFVDSEIARRLCNAPDYPDVARTALKEMHRQVGDLVVDDAGIAVSGILVRHLVMPADMAGTEGAMQYIAEEISKATYVNIMPQYRPCGAAGEMPELTSGISQSDYKAALETARAAGITRLDHRARIFWFL